MHRKAGLSARSPLLGSEDQEYHKCERRSNVVPCTRAKLVAVSAIMLLAGASVGLYARSLLFPPLGGSGHPEKQLQSLGGLFSQPSLRQARTSWASANAEGGVFESQYLSGEQGSSKLDVTRADAHDSVLQSAAIQEATVQDAIKTARAGAARQTIQTEFPWDLTAQFEKVTVCDDTCPKAKNQVCNDGRGQAMEVVCDLGTDCSDCGGFTHYLHRKPGSTSPTAPRPVDLLTKRNVQIFVRNTTTDPSFFMPYTDPRQDVDVSGQMAAWGVVELGLTQMWWNALGRNGGCRRSNGQRGLVLDVGSNFGYYAIYVAAMGCRVVAWEPVPHFRAFIEYAIALNNLSSLIEVRPFAVADKTGETYNLVVPQRGIWGTASINGGNIDSNVDNEGDYEKLVVKGERVDALIHEDVVLAKLDIEGFEPVAFESAQGILDGHTIENVVIEYSPGIYDKHFRWHDTPDWPKMLIFLVEHGYTIYHLTDGFVRPAPPANLKWREFVPPALEEITAENLKHDLDDARQLQERTLGCFKPQDLSKRFPFWGGCNAIPEDLHPKSFRACFGFNTNIWAALTPLPDRVPGANTVGILALDQDLSEWYSKDPAIGMGGRSCPHLSATIQVRHRCRCSNVTVCGEEAALVEQYAKRGLLPPQNGFALQAAATAL